MDSLRTGLQEHGFVDGRTIYYLDRVDIRCEAAEAEMKSMVRGGVDLIVVSSSMLAKVARNVTADSRTPVVFAPVYSAIDTGITATIFRPGGNMTGVQTVGSMAKALEYHTLALPAVRKVLVPYKRTDLIDSNSLEDLEKAAKKLGITLVKRGVDSPEDLKAAFANIPPGTGAIWLLNSNFLDSHYELFQEASRAHKLPVSGSTAFFPSLSPFLSYGPDLGQMGRQASILVIKVLKGIDPGDIPIEQAEYSLKINLAVAGELGIRVPEEILRQADEIIR